MRSSVRVIAATHQNLEDRVRLGSFREDLFHRLNVIRLRLPPLRERAEDVPALTRYFLQKSAKELGVEAKRISDSALARLTAFDFPGNVRQLENLCHWITVMAPAQVVEAKDLPPELLATVRPVAVPAASELNVLGAEPLVASAGSGSIAAAPESRAAEPATTPAASATLAATSVELAQLTTWLDGLESESRELLVQGSPEVWDLLARKFESKLILTALDVTRGRRIAAAQRLGIGRNTITRKIQELGLDS
jgi:two-component system nitrogen regulation response regulator GlnG